MNKKVLSDPVLKFFIVSIGIVVIGYTLKELADIFLPFVIAYFLFFTFSPLNKLLTKKKGPPVFSYNSGYCSYNFNYMGCFYISD
jgi:predicted PurR-regulated permease PerM